MPFHSLNQVPLAPSNDKCPPFSFIQEQYQFQNISSTATVVPYTTIEPNTVVICFSLAKLK